MYIITICICDIIWYVYIYIMIYAWLTIYILYIHIYICIYRMWCPHIQVSHWFGARLAFLRCRTCRESGFGESFTSSILIITYNLWWGLGSSPWNNHWYNHSWTSYSLELYQLMNITTAGVALGIRRAILFVFFSRCFFFYFCPVFWGRKEGRKEERKEGREPGRLYIHIYIYLYLFIYIYICVYIYIYI